MQMPLSVIGLLLLCTPVAPAIGACQRNEYGYFESEACAAEAKSTADQELKAVYTALLERLGPEDKENLIEAQDAWLAYQAAHASFIYGLEGDGSAGRTAVANYSERQVKARADELRSWLPKG